jgi:hypothetical protein
MITTCWMGEPDADRLVDSARGERLPESADGEEPPPQAESAAAATLIARYRVKSRVFTVVLL